jgi:hypothetical protein
VAERTPSPSPSPLPPPLAAPLLPRAPTKKLPRALVSTSSTPVLRRSLAWSHDSVLLLADEP